MATIAAPCDPAHVTGLFKQHIDKIRDTGEVEVQLAGRPFRIKREFLDDVAEQRIKERLATLRKALLVFHSPTDDIVGIENASRIFAAAKHPKSFVSLAGADHLLSKKSDAVYVANVIAAWAERYLDQPVERSDEQIEIGTVLVRETGNGKFQQEIMSGPHRFLADEPVKVGGLNSGPGPYDLLLAGLGACTSMTIRLYADSKKLPLERVSVRLTHNKIHAEDCLNCETKESMIDRIDRNITFEGALERRAAQAAAGDRRQVPGAPDAEVGDRNPHVRAAHLNFFAAGIFNRHARRRACTDAAIPCVGGGSAAQLRRRGSLAAELPALIHLGRRHFRRPGPLRERQQHAGSAAGSHGTWAKAPQRELIAFAPFLRKLRLR